MISLIITLALIGFGLFLIHLIPMPDWIWKIIVGVAILGTVLYVLSFFGVWAFPDWALEPPRHRHPR